MVIVCGWCGKPTTNWTRCSECAHIAPQRPWEQRGESVPTIPTHPAGRPPLDATELRKRLASLGPGATDDQIAERFEVDPRTVRRWRQKVSA